MDKLILAAQAFTRARCYEEVGEYNKADREYRKSDKLMAELTEEYLQSKKNVR